MFHVFRILGWSTAAVFYALAGSVVIYLGLLVTLTPVGIVLLPTYAHCGFPELLMLIPIGWLLLPGIFVIASRTRSRIARRRGLTVLDYLRQGIDLNLPLPRLLSAGTRSEKGVIGERFKAVENRIENGESVGEALGAVPELSPRTLSLVRAGEAVGRLPQALGRLVEQQRIDFKRESADASFVWGYPAGVISTMLLVLWWVLIFVLPKFEKIFDDFHTPMPEMTVRLMSFGKWLTGGFWGDQIVPGVAWLLLGILVVFFTPMFRRTRVGRKIIDRVLWHLPVSHGLERDRGMGDVCHLLEEASRAGVPIESALVEAGELQINVCLHRRVREWAAFVSSGATLERGAQSAQMPAILVGMLATGHESTSLPQALGFLGRYYDNRRGRAAAILQGAAVPIIVLVLAAIVAWIVVSLFLPLVVLIRSLSPTGIL